MSVSKKYFLAYRNHNSKKKLLNVVIRPFIITDDYKQKKRILQIISDTIFSLVLNIKNNECYDFYIIESDSPDNGNSILSARISEYLYNNINLINYYGIKQTFYSKLNSKNIDIKSKDVYLYNNNISFEFIYSVLIDYLPIEIIRIIYNMLNVLKMSFSNYKIDNKNTYICNPQISLNYESI